jgi:hypothetical protein
LLRAQGRLLLPDLNERVAYGRPATTPALDEMWAAWRTVTDAADPLARRARRGVSGSVERKFTMGW